MLHHPDNERILKTRKTFCNGFASLFKDLCTDLGIKCHYINGFVKFPGYKIGDSWEKNNHAWNVVQVRGFWYIIDCCWGAFDWTKPKGQSGTGADQNLAFTENTRDYSSHRYYFCPRPEEIKFTHYPADVRWMLQNPV